MNTKQRHIKFLVISLALMFGLVSISLAAQPNLMAAFFVKGKVGLKWSAVAGVTEYQIHRKAAGEDFVQVGTSSEDRWFDESVKAGTTYIYKVAIIEGGSPVFSSEKSVTIPGQTGDFAAPNWSGLRLEQNEIYLNWDKVPGAMAYNVWRSETSGGGYEVIGTSQGSRYVDKAGLVKGVTYYYVLSGMNAEFDETPQSEERGIKFGISIEEQKEAQAAENHVELVPYPMSLKRELTEGADGRLMNQPADVVVTSTGMVMVADALNGTIHAFAPSGDYKFSFGSLIAGNPSQYPDGGFLLPYALATNAADEIFVSDIKRNDIQVFDASGKFLRRINVDTGTGNEPLRANGLKVMTDGRLVMSDAGNHRFLITDPQGQILVATGSRGGEEGQFIFPDGIAVTANNEIFVVDSINARIQKFDIEGKFLLAFGDAGFTAGQFGRPKAVAFDGAGGLIWVSDGMSNMLQGFSTDGVIKSVLGTKDDGFTFVSPRGLCFDDGQLLVVQRLANKVAVYSVGP